MVSLPIISRHIVKPRIAFSKLSLSFTDEILNSLECFIDACDFADIVRPAVAVDFVLELIGLIGELGTGFACDIDTVGDLIIDGCTFVLRSLLVDCEIIRSKKSESALAPAHCKKLQGEKSTTHISQLFQSISHNHP